MTALLQCWYRTSAAATLLILLMVILRCFDAQNLSDDDKDQPDGEPEDIFYADDDESYSRWPTMRLNSDQDFSIHIGPERYYTYRRGEDDKEGAQLVGRLLDTHPDSLNPIRRQLADLIDYLRQDLATPSDRLMLRRIPQTSLNTFFDRALKLISHKRGPDPTQYRPPNIHVSKSMFSLFTSVGEFANILITGTETLHREGDVALQMTRQGDAMLLKLTFGYDRLDIEYDFNHILMETLLGFNVTFMKTHQRDYMSLEYIKLHATIVKLPESAISLNQVTLDFGEIKQHGTGVSHPAQTIGNYLLRFLFSSTTLSFQYNMNNSASYGPDETYPRRSGGTLLPFVILPLLI